MIQAPPKPASALQPRTFTGITTDPDTAIREATKAKEEQHAAGVKAMEEACGTEGKAPKDLLSAAILVVKLRKERDGLRERAEASEAAHIAMRAGVGEGCTALANGEAVKDGSPVMAAQAAFTRLIDERNEARAELEKIRTAARQSFMDMGFTEIPGLAGYFSGATPLLRAAEAAAIFMHGNDAAKEKYLRNRGWIMKVRGSWNDPSSSASFPYQAAVGVQVKRDVLPFRNLGTLEWQTEKSPKTQPDQVATMCDNLAKAIQPESIAEIHQKVGEIHRFLQALDEKPEEAKEPEVPADPLRVQT